MLCPVQLHRKQAVARLYVKSQPYPWTVVCYRSGRKNFADHLPSRFESQEGQSVLWEQSWLCRAFVIPFWVLWFMLLPAKAKAREDSQPSCTICQPFSLSSPSDIQLKKKSDLEVRCIFSCAYSFCFRVFR